MNDFITVKPFIKWAGGKSQVLPEIRKIYPKKITKYCEPFLGGGAVLFDVLANFSPDEVLVNDINKDLINTYIQLQTNYTSLIERLNILQDEFWRADIQTRKQIYLAKREKYNSIKNSETENLEKAVLFIFLNKTCFNGLYRVNSKGFFNVPIGSYKKPLICDTEKLEACSNLLQNVKFTCGDYSSTKDFIDENTFVYIDPPYRPLSNTASFTAYDNSNFSDKEQIELAHFVDAINLKNAKVVLSNSDPKNTDCNDDFFDCLYSKYEINRVNANRMINSKATNRGAIKELLIRNFKGV